MPPSLKTTNHPLILINNPIITKYIQFCPSQQSRTNYASPVSKLCRNYFYRQPVPAEGIPVDLLLHFLYKKSRGSAKPAADYHHLRAEYIDKAYKPFGKIIPEL